MNIYSTNYNLISKKEKIVFNKYLEESVSNDGIVTIDGRLRKVRKYFTNKKLRHYHSFFPNNYLDLEDLSTKSFKNKLNRFEKLLNRKSTSERHILNHINQNESHFIIASILYGLPFGHHDRYIFSEFELPPNYKADYLVVGKSSAGYSFILIELEKPYGRITQKDGDLGDTFRKGLNQIEDWSSYMDKNYTILKSVFDKNKHPDKQLPNEFYQFDKTRFSYAVIAGRRSDFKDKTYRIKNKYWKNDILLLHYDNLLDNSQEILQTGQY